MFRSNILQSLLQAGKRFITLEVFKGDNHKAKQYHGGGEDYNPPPNVEAIVVPINGNLADTAVLLYRDGITKIADLGEKRIYSTSADGQTFKVYVYLRNDGIIEINGASDFAVRYSELETAFNQLKSDFDALVTAYNAHAHPAGSPPGNTGAPLTPGNPSTADISGAKIDEILVP